MTLLSGRKSDDHLCQEHKKILKDILQRMCMEGQIESVKYAKGIKGDAEHKWISTKLEKIHKNCN